MVSALVASLLTSHNLTALVSSGNALRKLLQAEHSLHIISAMPNDDASGHLNTWMAEDRESHARSGRAAARTQRELIHREFDWHALLLKLTAEAACLRFDTRDGRNHTGTILEHGRDFVDVQLAGITRALLPTANITAISTATIQSNAAPAHEYATTSRLFLDVLESLVAERQHVSVNLTSSQTQIEGEAWAIAADFFTLRHHMTTGGFSHIPFTCIGALLFKSEFSSII